MIRSLAWRANHRLPVHPLPVLLIMTGNVPDAMYRELLQNDQQVLSGFVGPAQVLAGGDALRLKDHSKTGRPWYFDGETRQKRHEAAFPREMKKAFGMEAALIR